MARGTARRAAEAAETQAADEAAAQELADEIAKQLNSFYLLSELSTMTGYSYRRIRELLKRYNRRPYLNDQGKLVNRQGIYLQDSRDRASRRRDPMVNERFSTWLMSKRFKATVVEELRSDEIPLKQAVQEGLSYNRLRQLLAAGTISACVYKGVYHVSRREVEAYCQENNRNKQAPAEWIALASLDDVACQRTRQAIYKWASRKSSVRLFLHPKLRKLALYVPIRDALDYLSAVVNSAHQAILLLSRYASKYFRALGRAVLELFGDTPRLRLLLLEKEPDAVDVELVLTELICGPPPPPQQLAA